MDLHYDESTTSLILFEDLCYSRAFSVSESISSSFKSFLERHHSVRCHDPLLITRHKHRFSDYWSCPYSDIDMAYDPDMPPRTEPLVSCQIESIRAIGGVSTLELGIDRGLKSNGEADFIIDPNGGESFRKLLSNPEQQLWFSRCSTGLLLLSVPSKALEYKALEWILKSEDYRGLPIRLLPKSFMEGAVARGVGRNEALSELGAATLQGVRKCVVVDLRGIGIVRKVGLFMEEDDVHRLRKFDRPDASWGLPLQQLEGTPFRQKHELPGFDQVFQDKSLWEEVLGVGCSQEIRKERVVCYVKDLVGTVEILLFLNDTEEYTYGLASSKMESTS